MFVLSTFHSFTKSAPYDLIFFLTYFCLKPCIKAIASPRQPVQKFALFKIVAVYISLLFLILLASIHLCCCFKYSFHLPLYYFSSSFHCVILLWTFTKKRFSQVFIRFLYIISEASAALHSAISEYLSTFRNNLPPSLHAVSEKF